MSNTTGHQPEDKFARAEQAKYVVKLAPRGKGKKLPKSLTGRMVATDDRTFKKSLRSIGDDIASDFMKGGMRSEHGQCRA